MLLATSAVKTVFSFSQNGISPITLNKELGNDLNMDIINASRPNLNQGVPYLRLIYIHD
jgi:hypothetical protein